MPITDETAHMELLEHSRVKYECTRGFKLKTTMKTDSFLNFPFSNVLNAQKYAQQNYVKHGKTANFYVDKCEPIERGVDDRQRNVFDFLNVDLFDYDLGSSAQKLFNSNFNSMPIRRQKLHHECVKYCEPFRINYSLSKLFVAPIRRDTFLPGEHLRVHCNEGHVTTLIDETSYVNEFDLECANNGKWHLQQYQVTRGQT